MTTEEGPQEGVGARTQPALTRQDFADLTRHLRTVHFSLFLACAVLWISAAVTSRTGAAAAREQFQHIMRMHSDWEQWTVRYAKEQKDWLIANEPFFTDQFQNALRRTLYADVAELSDAGVNTTHSWSIGLRRAPIEVITSFRTIDSEEELILARYIGPGFASGSKSLVTTLNGFRGFWDGADRVIVIVQSIPSPEMYVLSEGEIQRNLPGGAQPGFRLQSKLRLEQHIVGDLPSTTVLQRTISM